MRKLAILGSTGSIGQNALNVIEHLGEEYAAVALAAKSNIDLLEVQARKFQPEIIAVFEEEKALELQKRLPEIPVLSGFEGIEGIARYESSDLVLSAMCGFDGVRPTIAAIEAGKDIALANKEALVAGGKLVMEKVAKFGVSLIPVDSEHTAIFQCLKGENPKEAIKILLTASGGPFREFSKERLKSVTIEDALSHPNYDMGAKVTIDSSTLMNKGLEMIEAHFLYDLPIEVLVHPEQVVHSMVEFIDGSIMAHMGRPNMLVPIQYALTHPVRRAGILDPLDFTKYPTLNFSKWDADRFRCLDLAYQAVNEGESTTCFLNAANEILVSRFLNREISWMHIGQKLENLLNKHKKQKVANFETLASIDEQARELAKQI